MQPHYPFETQDQEPGSKKKLLLVIAGFILLVVILGIGKYFQILNNMGKRPVFPPFKVTSFVAKEIPLQNQIALVGDLNPISGAVLRAEESGVITEVYFQPGSKVKQGDLLVDIDPDALSAELLMAQAKEKQAQQAFKRAKVLRPKDAISQAEFEQAESDFTTAQADSLRISSLLKRRQIRAPFEASVGVRSITVGDLVSVGDELVSVFNDQKLFLDFKAPEAVSSLLKIDQELEFSVDSLPERKFNARLTAVNPQIDSNDRMIAVQGIVENSKAELKSGMSAKINLFFGASKPEIVIPASSISYAPYGDSVYVITKIKDETNREYLGVEQRFVKTGVQQGDLIVIKSGVKVGEEIVSSGAFKLRPNQEVEVDNKLTPDAALKPEPEDA